LGTANFNQIPINKPVCPFHTNRRGGFANHEVYKGKANYEPNSVDENWPREAVQDKGAFSSYPEPIEASKLRVRPESFADHFSQATLHYTSLKKHEQQHIKDAYAFELSKVKDEAIRQRVIDRILVNIDEDLATYVANELGLKPSTKPENKKQSQVKTSEKLSIDAFPAPDIKQRKIAVLVHDGSNTNSVDAVKAWAESENAVAEILAPSSAPVKSKDGKEIAVDGRQNGEPSVTYDAVVVIDGDNLDTFKADGVAKHYVLETYKHLKPIYLIDDKKALIDYLGIQSDDAVFSSKSFMDQQDDFKLAIQNHRLWSREDVVAGIPA
ncbi:MAG: catalase-related domain-containing protein, partial [Acinetobacter junii]